MGYKCEDVLAHTIKVSLTNHGCELILVNYRLAPTRYAGTCEHIYRQDEIGNAGRETGWILIDPFNCLQIKKIKLASRQVPTTMNVYDCRNKNHDINTILIIDNKIIINDKKIHTHTLYINNMIIYLALFHGLYFATRFRKLDKN